MSEHRLASVLANCFQKYIRALEEENAELQEKLDAIAEIFVGDDNDEEGGDEESEDDDE